MIFYIFLNNLYIIFFITNTSSNSLKSEKFEVWNWRKQISISTSTTLNEYVKVASSFKYLGVP